MPTHMRRSAMRRNNWSFNSPLCSGEIIDTCIEYSLYFQYTKASNDIQSRWFQSFYTDMNIHVRISFLRCYVKWVIWINKLLNDWLYWYPWLNYLDRRYFHCWICLLCNMTTEHVFHHPCYWINKSDISNA